MIAKCRSVLYKQLCKNSLLYSDKALSVPIISDVNDSGIYNKMFLLCSMFIPRVLTSLFSIKTNYLL